MVSTHISHTIRSIPMTLEIKVPTEFNVRVWISVRLIRLAIWIVGGKSSVETE